jgi:alcohol oxidase
MPPGKFFTMFHFLEYPFSRGFTHINSADPYDTPDFDAGFMNDKRDMAPMVWGYIQSRETARRMHAYAGEVTAMHPHFSYSSEARAKDMDLATRNAYGGPNHITANIQHGSWTMPVEAGEPPQPNLLNSNCQTVNAPLKYSKEVSNSTPILTTVADEHDRTLHTSRSGSSATVRPLGTRSELAAWLLAKAMMLSSTVFSMRD